jgi:hypothetical protein
MNRSRVAYVRPRPTTSPRPSARGSVETLAEPCERHFLFRSRREYPPPHATHEVCRSLSARNSIRILAGHTPIRPWLLRATCPGEGLRVRRKFHREGRFHRNASMTDGVGSRAAENVSFFIRTRRRPKEHLARNRFR